MLVIYNDDLYSFIEQYKKDIIEDLKNNDEIINDENIEKYARSIIDDDFYSVKSALNTIDNLNNGNVKILCVASLGLWYGRREGKKIFNSLSDAVFSLTEDYNTIYFKTKKSTLSLEAIHHDGTNNFKFYELRGGKKYAINYDSVANWLY